MGVLDISPRINLGTRGLRDQLRKQMTTDLVNICFDWLDPIFSCDVLQNLTVEAVENLFSDRKQLAKHND
jgi:hypothetical protein